MTNSDDIAKQLRALVIMDEAGSNNPLGRDAAKTIEKLQATVEAHSLELDRMVAECASLHQKIFSLNEQNSALTNALGMAVKELDPDGVAAVYARKALEDSR